MITPEEVTTVWVNGYPVAVHQMHRRWTTGDYVPGAPAGGEYEPVAVTVSAAVGLSLQDVVAVLFSADLRYEDTWALDDDGIRSMVADVVLNMGGRKLEDLRCQLGEAVLAEAGAAHLAWCRLRASSLFGAVSPVGVGVV